ncbi:TadE/TadG family type IV pilus assembly protein [Roseospirillum parvum]|uniref:Flp pilus assembly protein TadG n=1 Tax=Roseospirillum parvum TaxID=83401 RepID=A0A1G8EH28_9PROT|nr:TadE/TadG family type IV pilus assembly protein [Roseospirillum parvum]SDH69215.1 Flp pilus assembly protein TadG [Roseospirillum parvum]
MWTPSSPFARALARRPGVPRLARRLGQLPGDRRGVTAVLFAVALIPLVLAVGVAVDISRAYMVKARLGHALDAAGLAVGSMADRTDETANKAMLDRFFYANYPSDVVGTVTELNMSEVDNVITLTATVEMKTSFMTLAGIDTIEVAGFSEVTRETKGLELVMVLDNTGSMAGTKLSSMKTAATNLVNILFGSDETSDNLYIGLVPFAGTVNIGSDNTALTSGPPYIEQSLKDAGLNDGTTYMGPNDDRFTYDGWGPISGWGPTSTHWWTGDTTYNWWGCVDARPYPNDVEDTDTTSGGFWRPYYWADTPYNSSNPDWDAGNANNWRWSNGSTYDIDNTGPSTLGPNKGCPRELTPLTNTKQTLIDEIDAMWADGYTHINIGAVWGWRVISPGEPFTGSKAYGEEDWNKAVIILTDGDNTTHDQVDTAYGYRWEGKLAGYTSGWQTEGELDDRLSEVCTGMKNLGIIVYTITFQVSSSSTRTLMENCATDSGKYYNSPTESELNAVFEKIANELSNLRLSK